MVPLRRSDEQALLINEASILSRWREHLKALFSAERIFYYSAILRIPHQPIKSELDEPPFVYFPGEVIIILYKNEGEKLNCSNYTEIILLSIKEKIFARNFLKRLVTSIAVGHHPESRQT